MRATAAAVLALLLLLAAVGGNYLLTEHYVNATQAAAARLELAQQREQRQAGLLVEHSICATLGQLAALKPPPGDPATNPSRAFDDRLHATLDGLGPDLGCR